MYKALMMTLLIHLPVVVVFGSAAFIAMAAADAGVTTVTVPNSNNSPWPSTRNQDMEVAKEEMQRANYFAYVMLINLAPSHLFSGNVTFLMPNDRALANNMSRQNIEVADFLLRHSIPSPLLMEDLQHFPTGSKLPTCSSWPPPPNDHDQLLLGITNNGRRSFFLNNVRIISPNICTRGSSIRCHGIDGVIQDSVPPAGADQCHNNNNNSSGTTTPPSPSPSPSAAAPTTDDKNDTGTNSGSNAAGPGGHDDHPKKSAANSVVVVNKCYFGGGRHEILRSGCLSLTLVLLTLIKHCP